MGCFDSTCAITRSAIKTGDRVLYYRLLPRYPQLLGVYDLLIYLQQDIPHPWGICGKVWQDLAIGVYDDYGSIEGLGIEPDFERQGFIHLEAVEFVLGRSPDDLKADMLAIVEYCYYARIELLQGGLGNQSDGSKEITAQWELARFNARFLGKRRVEALREEAGEGKLLAEFVPID